MTASDLRELAESLGDLALGMERNDKDAVHAAVGVLELIAWAEDSEVHVERYGGMWFVYVLSNGVEYGNHSFIDTLRRAREAAR